MGGFLGSVMMLGVIGGLAWLAEKSAMVNSALDILEILAERGWTIGFRLLLWLFIAVWAPGFWAWVFLAVAIVIPILNAPVIEAFEFVEPVTFVAEFGFHVALFFAVLSIEGFWLALFLAGGSIAFQYLL